MHEVGMLAVTMSWTHGRSRRFGALPTLLFHGCFRDEGLDRERL